MTQEEQFTCILEKGHYNSLLPFLQDLDKDQRKNLVPHIKKLSKEYLEYRPTTFFSYAQKASQTQEKMLRIAAFFCFNLTDYKKHDSFGYIITKDLVGKQILDWYCPDWFSAYINGYSQVEFIPYQMTYGYVMELAEKGYVIPQKELLVKLIPQIIFQQNDNTNIWEYKPQHLLQRNITLEEHIWYLFELESTINWSDRYMRFGQESQGEDKSWIQALKTFSSEGKIDRKRLLKEAILATSKNFNKTLSGWFAQLFIALEPTTEELLGLQNELFNTFNSPHSKPISTSLQYVKRLAEEAAFDSNGFLDNVSLLLSSETKIIVSSTLLILEKLAKKYAHQREEICKVACQVFIHREDGLQTKAAKLIQKYGEPSSRVLQDTLSQYYESMLSNTRSMLADFTGQTVLEKSSSSKSSAIGKPNLRISEENEIKLITDIDELIFLTSQAFDNNESYHFDVLPAALITLQDEIKGENIAKLTPAFQRAYKLIMDSWQSNTGHVDHLLATFFIEYGRLLMKEFPVESKSIKEIHEKYTGKDEGFKKQWSHYQLRIGRLEEWKTYNHDTIYEPFKKLLLEALDKIKTKNTLPLLSTPTHSPGWIAPIELISRIRQYQEKGITPNDMDFQIAISRCAFENTEEALNEAVATLTGEYRELMRFLLVKEAKPQGPFDHKSVWMIASLTKSPQTRYEEFSTFSYNKLSRNFLTGQFAWKTFVETYTYDRYDYQKRNYIKVRDTRKTLQIEMNNKIRKETTLDTILKFISPKEEDEQLIYEYMPIKGQYLAVTHTDMKRLMMLTPNNPEPLLAQLVHKWLKCLSSSEEGDKKVLIKTLEVLLEIWKEFGEMAHLFVATCMLSSDKTVRSFGAEIWVNGVNQGMINSELLGEIIGKHESIEFAPLKRLTDVITDNMLQISEHHNLELERMLTSILIQLPANPVNHLKKLLELYIEILSLNHSSIDHPKIASQLEGWKPIASLTKVVKTLQERIFIEAENQSMLI